MSENIRQFLKDIDSNENIELIGITIQYCINGKTSYKPLKEQFKKVKEEFPDIIQTYHIDRIVLENQEGAIKDLINIFENISDLNETRIMGYVIIDSEDLKPYDENYFEYPESDFIKRMMEEMKE